MKTIYFIRHGETKYNEEGRFIGKTDLHLTHKGRKAVSEMWDKRAANIQKELLFTSPMKRCVETAGIIFPEDSVIILNNMREMDFGIFESNTPDELSSNPDYIKFVESKAQCKIPEGESGIEFSRRVLKAFFEMISIMNKEKVSSAALICHGGVIMALFSILCRESNDIFYYHTGNAKGYHAQYDENKKELIIIEKI